MQNFIKEAPSLTVTRIYGNFPAKRIAETVSTFGKISSPQRPTLIVSHKSYAYKEALARAVATQRESGGNIEVVYSRVRHRPDRTDHAGMLNNGVRRAAELGMEYFTIVSSDLGEHVPDIVPRAKRVLQGDPRILMVGATIDSVHDMVLHDQALLEGKEVVHPGNFGDIFPTNTFVVHRLHPLAPDGIVSAHDRMFGQLYEEDLGSTEIDGEHVPLWGHEDLEPPIRLLGENRPVDIVLLAGNGNVVFRDKTKEVPTHPFKSQTRQLVAAGYQRYHGVSEGDMKGYLSEHFHIETG